MQDKKLGGHSGTDGGELPERNLVWLTYRGLVAPSDKGSYFTPVPCWRVGWGSLENTSKDSEAYPGRKTKPWQSRGTERGRGEEESTGFGGEGQYEVIRTATILGMCTLATRKTLSLRQIQTKS